ncbi:MAG: hypothetical protein LBR17_07315 [Bacteroidales bacterium]|nr:hypothetical protein [Bacteroidales bacterium]
MKKQRFDWAKARRIMSKTLCSVMIATAIVSFSSCSDDDEDNNNGGGATSQFTSLQVNVANGSQYTDIAKVVAGYLDEPYSNVADYNNGNFTLEMLTPAAEDLWLFAEGAPATITFSDASVKVAIFSYIACYDSYLSMLGFIYFGKQVSGEDADASFIYADRDCNVTGTVNGNAGSTNYTLLLKKGWNIVYFVYKEGWNEAIATTTPQSGFQWIMYYYGTEAGKTSAQKSETKGFWKF